MAIRSKTVIIPITTDVSTLANNTNIDQAVTVYIPESTATNPVTFTSATVEIGFMDITTQGANLANWNIGVELDSLGMTELSGGAQIGQTGENQSYLLNRDFTSYFNTNFSGPTQSLTVRFRNSQNLFGPFGSRNVSVKVILSYNYDDSATTRIKTVPIVLDSNPSTLTDVLSEVGTNQIPALDTFLPESSKVYRYIWFEIFSFDKKTGTTDFSLRVALDAESEVAFADHEAFLNSSILAWFTWVRNDLDTSITHSFNARSTLSGTFENFSVVMWVTYEYDHAASTSILNTQWLSMDVREQLQAPGSENKVLKRIYIEEPGPISLVQCGVLASYTGEDGTTLGLAFGSDDEQNPTNSQLQTPISYENASGTRQCGTKIITHRVDSGSVGGEAFSLVRGENLIRMETSRSTSSDFVQFGAILFLNYTSGKHAEGDGVHAHTVFHYRYHGFDSFNTALNRSWSDREIPEDSYYINSVGMYGLMRISATSVHFGLAISREIGDTIEEGNEQLVSSFYVSEDNEGRPFLMLNDLTDSFKQWPQQNGGVEYGPLRTAIKIGSANAYHSISTFVTYYSKVYQVSGEITEYQALGDDIRVMASIDEDGTFIGEDSQAPTGTVTFSIDWYDNTKDVLAHAFQSNTKLGRSQRGPAV